jgi:hypothetical protein
MVRMISIIVHEGYDTVEAMRELGIHQNKV